MDYKKLPALDLNTINQVAFPEDHYFKEEQVKKQIVLHHTISDTLNSVISTWTEKPQHVATPFVISKDGTINQLFSSKYWAIHLFRNSSPFDKVGIPNGKTQRYIIEKQSIGIEILSWGGIYKGDGKTKKDFGHGEIILQNGKYYAIYGNILNLKDEQVLHIPEGFMGYYYFDKYTDQQLISIYKLLKYLCNRYNIDLKYNSDMWNLNKNALSGQNSIFTHVSMRGSEKSDCFPQPELIEMLKALK